MITFKRFLTILAVGTLALSACTPKKKADSLTDSNVSSSDIAAGNADSDSGMAMGLQTVNFAYDSAALDPHAKETLKANAAVLKEKTNLKVQIEGHTDARGGIQYNLALGERRANSARSYLIDHGVNAERITTISYGKERPVDAGTDDSAYAKNRRANFRITEK